VASAIRRVQLAAFMSMNIDRHVKAHKELYENLRDGQIEKAEATKAFYDEYFAVLDLTAEFYLETVRLVFQEHALPLGNLKWRAHKSLKARIFLLLFLYCSLSRSPKPASTPPLCSTCWFGAACERNRS
jgi:poly-beta-hydroxyalkanoate depolymerase